MCVSVCVYVSGPTGLCVSWAFYHCQRPWGESREEEDEEEEEGGSGEGMVISPR